MGVFLHQVMNGKTKMRIRGKTPTPPSPKRKSPRTKQAKTTLADARVPKKGTTQDHPRKRDSPQAQKDPRPPTQMRESPSEQKPRLPSKARESPRTASHHENMLLITVFGNSSRTP